MTDETRSEASIGLAELIAAVRCELERASAGRVERADDLLLELREVELEIQFEVTRADDGEGVDCHVLAAGGDARADETGRVQRLRVLYGPAFKLVELDEGAGSDGVPDWLRAR